MATHHILLAVITGLIVVIVAAVVGVGLYFSSRCTLSDFPSCPGTDNTSSSTASSGGCTQRRYTPSQLDHRAIDSCVCVCSEQLGCDQPLPTGDISNGRLVYYLSSRDGDRLRRYDTDFSTAGDSSSGSSGYTQLTVTVNGNRRYQEILGFGGAFTDAAGVNINAMSEANIDMIMRAYFGEDGSFKILFSKNPNTFKNVALGANYTLCRVPIASTDFSTRVYSYDNSTDDFYMMNFSLADEDLQLKIPLIQRANLLTQGRLQLFAAPWSAPGWMKTNGNMVGGAPVQGAIDGPYFQAYGQYYIRFFEEYWKRGVMFWALSLQNEPSNGRNPYMRYQSTFWNGTMMRDFVAQVLGPAIQGSTATEKLKLMGNDDNRNWLWSFATDVGGSLIEL